MHPFVCFNDVTDTRFGKMIYNVNDVYVGRSLSVYGEFSWGEVELLQQVVRTGAVVVEVGANVGATRCSSLVTWDRRASSMHSSRSALSFRRCAATWR